MWKASKVQEIPQPMEHILNIVKAGLASAPFCGGIASLMSDYIPSRKFQRLEKFARDIAADLSALKEKVQEERFNTDEFASVFEKCFRGAAENYQKEKIECFRSILLNTATGSVLLDDEKEYFIGLLNSLTVLHIRILKFMVYPREYLRENSISEDRITGGFSDFFPVAIPGIALDVIVAAFSDLYRLNLISSGPVVFATETSSNGLRLLGNRVTELGSKFMGFITRRHEV